MDDDIPLSSRYDYLSVGFLDGREGNRRTVKRGCGTSPQLRSQSRPKYTVFKLHGVQLGGGYFFPVPPIHGSKW